MGITSALVTGLSGLATNQSQINVVGNNISNVNTVGFKSSRLDFKTQFLQNYSFGTAPSDEQGGTNPLQIGLGTQAGAISRDFGDGSLQVTGVNTNLAMQGNGFFVLKDVSQQVYTRDGSFQINGLNQLVSSTGQLVQGYGVDSNYNVVPGVLSSVTIPLGSLTVAKATENATMTGQLNSSGDLPTSVAVLNTGPLNLSNGAGGVDPTNPPTGATLLTNVTDGTGAAYFQVGDVINLAGKKGAPAAGTTPSDASTLPTKTMTVTATTSLADLQSFMTGSLGINTAAGANGGVATAPGVTVPATGNTASLTISGNPGAENDITMSPSDLSITRGASTVTPFTWNNVSAADGESTRTSLTVQDSLGTSLQVGVTAVLESKNSSGSTWRFFATSPDGTASGANTQTAVGTGTMTYDTLGHLTSTTTPTFDIDRSNTGANPNLSVTMDFSATNSLSKSGSDLKSSFEDGAPPGTLTSFSIGTDGIVTGSFDNGQARKLGQIAVATFRNDQGLIDRGSNSFIEGPNSGNAIISAPEELSAGRISSGALELSNVDLSGEFVQLISASTGFSASSRVITTSNQLLQELLQSAR